MKNLHLLVTALLFATTSMAQMTAEELRTFLNTASEQELLIECSSMTQEYYYYNGEKVIDKLLTFQPESANYNYRKGYLVLNSRLDYATAIPYLEKAIKDINKNFDAYSTRETSAPPDAIYHLAACYHLDDQLDKAKEHYALFISSSAKKSGLIPIAEMNIKQCDVAKHEMKNPKKVKVNNLGNTVNTSMAEYSPAVSLDGQSLYFTSRRPWEDGSTEQYRDPKLNNYPEDVYVSYLGEGNTWTAPEKLAFCDAQLNEATISVSGDERRIYIYQDYTGGGDIYYSDFSNNDFEQLRALKNDEVNTKSWETHCTVTPDGENMYFVSDRPGGYGGRDIYRVTKLPNGEWSKAQNLGPGINTPYDEDAPFIAVDNKTLYFSSNGDKSMGGFDVFVTFRDEMNNWSTPLNMGYPINSTGNDIFYTTTFDGTRGYLSSFRKDGFGEKDIYEIQNDYMGSNAISAVRGKVITTDDSPLPDNLTVRIECLNCAIDEEKEILPRVKNGTYFSLLSRCKEYKVHFMDGDQTLRTENIVTKCNAESEELERNYIIGRYTLAGTVTNKNTSAPIANATVEIIDATTEKTLATVKTDANGAYTSSILDDKNYEDVLDLKVKSSAKDYLAQTNVETITLGMEPNIQLNYKLKQIEVGIEVGTELALNPIYFDVDKADIRPDAALELDKIVAFMNENPTVVIELGSHTDCRASEAYNKALSNRRAISSANYIKQRITNKKRINGKGFGESQLVNDCGCEGDVVSDCSEEEHQANRRTEFKIIKM